MTDKSQKPRKAKKADLLGKSVEIQFPRTRVAVDYLPCGMMKWEMLDQEDGRGQERASILQLAEGLYYLNWIEKTKFSVSQVIDLNAGTVRAFWSYPDETDQGKTRSSMFIDGVVKLKEGAT